MKSIYNKFRTIGDLNSKHFPTFLSLVLMLFFAVFGSLSLFILLQSPV